MVLVSPIQPLHGHSRSSLLAEEGVPDPSERVQVQGLVSSGGHHSGDHSQEIS